MSLSPLRADAATAAASHHLQALLDQPTDTPVGLAALPHILERASLEIQNVLANLRDSRGALEAAAVDNVRRTHEKLREVTSTTEDAATSILDALDRVQTMVDEMQTAEQAQDFAKTAETRENVRTEVFGMMGALQFQDITSQQLAYAASVLSEMEGRLLSIAKLFDPATVMVRVTTGTVDPKTFDPNATTKHAERRQSLADTIFG